ncbi:MAG: DUF5829 family protein [Gemmatimonadota bacterium]
MKPLALCAALGVLVAPLAAQRPATPVLLNHLYAVIDSATYAEIVASPFLSTQFAGFKAKTPATFFGHHTYLELFDPGGFDGARDGDVGIAFATETPGGVAAVARAMSGYGATFDTTTERRGTPRQSEAFFHRWQPSGRDATSPRSAFWLMEYAAEAARSLSVRDSLPESDIGRDRFLASRFVDSLLLGDLTAATVAIPAADIATLMRTMQRLGVEVFTEGEGAVIRIPGFTLRLLPAWERPGLRRLEFSLLREAPANPSLKFGAHSRLRFGPGRVAAWDFSLP